MKKTRTKYYIAKERVGRTEDHGLRNAYFECFWWIPIKAEYIPLPGYDPRLNT
jgi:hypothetical protein